MTSTETPTAARTGPLLRVVPIATGGWRVAIDGLPPSDYLSRDEAMTEAEAYIAGHGRGGEVIVADVDVGLEASG